MPTVVGQDKRKRPDVGVAAALIGAVLIGAVPIVISVRGEHDQRL